MNSHTGRRFHPRCEHAIPCCAEEPPPAPMEIALGEISVPTLVTCGRYDMCTPVQAKVIHDGIARSEFVVFEESSRYPHVEETDRYLTVVHEFMTRAEHQAVMGALRYHIVN